MDYAQTLGELTPVPDGETAMRHRLGIVDTVNAGGTVDVDFDGTVVAGVAVLDGSPLNAGDVVQVAVWKGDLLVLGRTAAAAQGVVPYTPALTASVSNPTLGTGSVRQGLYVRRGPEVTVFFKIAFGSSGAAAGSGLYRVSLPFDRHADIGDHGCGTVILVGTGVDMAVCFLSASIADVIQFRTDDNTVANNHPWTWAANHILEGSVTYLVDET